METHCEALDRFGTYATGSRASGPALMLNAMRKRFPLNVLSDALKDAPGFDKDHSPSMADTTRADGVYRFRCTACSGS